MKNCYKLFCLLLCLLLPPLVLAQDKTEINTPTVRHWYVGVQGGLPFGVSTFSSFGEYKTRAGYNFGALAGYRISPLFSAEVSVLFGNVGLGTNKCCADYFLGADGVRYLTPVAGAESYSYRDIYSSVFMQQYGLRLNIDMMQIVRPDYNKRWSVLLSPAIYSVGSRATIKTTDGTEVMKADSRFKFGAGADVGVSYQINDRLGIRLMSGVNFVMGSHFDGLPGGDHGENLVWNNNLSLTWRFGSCKRTKQQSTTQTVTTLARVEPKVEPKIEPQKEAEPETVKPQEIIPIADKPQADTIKVTVPQYEPQAATKIESDIDTLVFPSIYYRTDDVEVRIGQQQKLMQIVSILKKHPNLHVTIIGHGDSTGTKVINDRISRLRANGVKYRLVKRGIASNRITTIGAGIDTTTVNHKARRVDVKQTNKQAEQ